MASMGDFFASLYIWYLIDNQLYYIDLYEIDGLVQKRPNSIANALELRLSCTNPLNLTLQMSVPSYVRPKLGQISWCCEETWSAWLHFQCHVKIGEQTTTSSYCKHNWVRNNEPMIQPDVEAFGLY